MSEFIEECRREWKRLRVPDSLADEMAADLAVDLREAEAEGASPEELLGEAASDPQAFARSWAEERGLVTLPPSARRRRLVIAVLVLTVLIGGGLAAGLLLTKGKAQSPVAVPYFVGSNRAGAIAEAKSAGLNVTIRIRNGGRGRSGTVVAQSPDAGARVQRGTELLLVVRR